MTLVNTDFHAAAEAEYEAMVALRRAIHADPELGLHCPRTSAKLKASLEGLPLEIRDSTSTSGFVAILRGARPGRTVLLRGDMDALPIHEETGLDFASQTPGHMHACGHDSHSAMLSAAARILSAQQASLEGTIVFMFQPGEEGHHGARFMIEDGLLDDPTPDAAFALHICLRRRRRPRLHRRSADRPGLSRHPQRPARGRHGRGAQHRPVRRGHL
jgi:hippurate hydrolase